MVTGVAGTAGDVLAGVLPAGVLPAGVDAADEPQAETAAATTKPKPKPNSLIRTVRRRSAIFVPFRCNGSR